MQPHDQISNLETSRRADRSAPCVFAIHGSASSGRQWSALADQLMGVAQVIAPDLLGYGAAVDHAGDRLSALRAALPAEGRVHLVGHSFGGAVALRLAHACPTRVASVTLYDPITAQPDATGRHLLPGALDAIWRDCATAPASELMRRFFDFWTSGPLWADLALRKQERLVAHHTGLCRDLTEITRGDWAISEPRFDGPVTLFRGQRSPGIIARMAEEIAGAHRQASIHLVPGLGHFAPLSHPEVVNPLLASALFHPAARAA